MSVVPLSVPPPVLAKMTVWPPAVRALLLMSRACTVMSWVLVPLAVITVVAGLKVEWTALTAPGVNVTAEDEVPTEVPICKPPRVAVTVATPATVGAVNVVT